MDEWVRTVEMMGGQMDVSAERLTNQMKDERS